MTFIDKLSIYIRDVICEENLKKWVPEALTDKLAGKRFMSENFIIAYSHVKRT